MHGSETDVTLKLPLKQETRDPPAHIREDYSKSHLDYSQLNRDLYFERVILWWAQTKSLHDRYVNSPNYMAAPSFRDDLDFEDDDQLRYCIALYLYNQSALPDELVFTLRYEKRPPVSKKRFYRAIIGRFLDAKAYCISSYFSFRNIRVGTNGTRTSSIFGQIQITSARSENL